MKNIIIIMLAMTLGLQAQERYIYTSTGNRIVFNESEKLFVEVSNINDTTILNQVSAYIRSIDSEMIRVTDNSFIATLQPSELEYIETTFHNSSVYSTHVLSHGTNDKAWASNRIFVRTRENESPMVLLRQLNVRYDTLWQIGSDADLYLVTLSRGQDAIDVSNEIFESGQTVYSHPDFGMFVDMHNELYDEQWGLHNEDNGYDINVEPA